MSSLAVQLAQSASLNSALLADRSRRKPGESYLFTGREADQHDLESIHALGVNGLLQLASLDPALRGFEDQLFSEYAKSIDRTLLSAEANTELNKSIANFLALLAPYLMETPTGKVMEWLVRRYRINEFNVEALLSLFLPYHESPHFAKMVTILHIKQNSTWSFLLAFKSAAQSLPRISLVNEMLRNSDVARFVTSLLPTAIQRGRPHRVLLAFNAACLHDFILRSQDLDEGTLAYLLPALLEPLQNTSGVKDAILGSYILLSALSQKAQLAPSVLKSIVAAMTGCASKVSTTQFTNAILAVCEQQPELDHFSDKTVKAILQIPNIGDELRSAVSWMGIEKILCPLLPGLEKRLEDDLASSLFESILSIPNIPNAVVRRSATVLLNIAVSAELTDISSTTRRLLSVLQQRHPVALHDAVEHLSNQNEALKESVEQLVLSLSVIGGISESNAGPKENVDMILASTSADPKARAIAVKALLSTLSGTGSGTPGLESIYSALLARVQDTNQAVVDALYANPSVIVPVFVGNSQAYINNLAEVLTSTGAKPKRSLLRSHLTFLVSHFCSASPADMGNVFHRVLFPFLLFSKPRQHTAEVVWDVISDQNDRTLQLHEWLSGCAQIVELSKASEDVDIIQRLRDINTATSTQIAENILKSNDYQIHFEALVVKLGDSNPHSRIFGYMITRALLRILSGEHQLSATHRALEVMAIDEISGVEDLPADTPDLFEFIDEKSLGKSVVTKPSSRSTSHWMQISIVALASTISPPPGTIIDWLTMAAPNPSDQRGPRYVGLMRKIYELVNASTSVPLLTIQLLRSLFDNLKDNSLAFLAGIWISPIRPNEADHLRVTALDHASAFLQAHLSEEATIDFQTILPSLLIVLQSRDQAQREIALTCISHLLQLAERRFTTVYKFDVIYGTVQDQLQYLDRDDFKKYLNCLVEYKDHLEHDIDYIKTLHQSHLGRRKNDKKRESEYKNRVLCYLLSHINAIALSGARIVLLQTLEPISSNAKTLVLLPTIQALDRSLGQGNKSGAFPDELTSLLISCFDASATQDLNDGQSVLWDVFTSLLRHIFTGTQQSVRVILSRALERDLFAGLNMDRKIGICNLLLDTSSHDADSHASCKQLLGCLIKDATLIIRMLTLLMPSTPGTVSRATKRAKLTDTPEDIYLRLSIFVEVLGTQSLPGSLDLISQLLETLNRVVQSTSSTPADASYIEQLLMSAIENVALKITETPNLSPSVVRLDILVELIRVASNPQTFHQALLLMANLAHLAPESVLHNVMPIFTFMGSNVFHRDDTYSFRVVQQTIDSIVPVMVSSLKNEHLQPLELYIGSKEFLRVFTDAANHIPRHRRTKFFTHLIDVLGSGDFLAPICMLLIEKVVNRVVRQTPDEVQNILSLPLSILQHSPLELQIKALIEILHESQRLASRVTHPGTLERVFLDLSLDEENSTPPSNTLRRRAQALIIFSGYAMKPSSADFSYSTHDKDMGELVTSLISLATLQGGVDTETKVDDICFASRASIGQTLGVMSVMDFTKAILSMIESNDSKIQEGALELLNERLPDVSTETRREIVPIVIQIIEAIQKLLTKQTNTAIPPSAFRAIQSIGITMCPGEELSLTGIIPQILTSMKEGVASPSALSALLPLPAKLGPRIIPYFRDIVLRCVTVIHEGSTDMTDNAFAVLHGLLTSIPSFWGAGELKQVVALYIDHYVSMPNKSSSTMLSLVRTMTKRASPNALLPMMTETWINLKETSQLDRVAAFFDVLTRSLRSASRPVVLAQLRPLFSLFIEALDLVKGSIGESNAAETYVIMSFKELVIKLNDAAFRPLFRRLYDWAFTDKTGDINVARRITFCRLYDALLDFFKGLMNPYMSFLLEPFTEALQAFSSGALNNQLYWTGVLQTITKSLTFDDGAFWRDDKHRQIISPVIGQVAVCIKLNYGDGKNLLQECLSALTDNTTDDTLLKAINLDLLMHTRSEDVRVRLLALTYSEALWRAHGGKLMGFASETATFIAECSEDENDMIVRESFKLKDAVESIAGNINGT